MSRARVAALALVNWKGVFFERYLLDRHVTALEGSNGAGKTTVMIAAYVVLLPDMTRLRFTNLGESGATGGDRGIWGRLGEPGRPAYAALDLDLDGQRVVLGVCLTRTTEPTVEPTAFMVNGLPESARLSDFLLARRDDGDHVPELAELKLAAAKAGGTITVFRSVKEYFSALFERGITPLCLSFEEERNKWNDMLRTSMTGGISRALGTELRNFLLRQESGLSDTLSRMRDNLESCRRTRLEVFEARQLEREISAIYEAGLAMFSAALHAARAASIEAKTRAREAAEASLRARQAQTAWKETAAELSRKDGELTQQSEHKRQELAQLEAAKQRQAAAAQLSQRLTALDAELEVAVQKLEAATALQQDQHSAREAAQQAREWTLEAYDRASVGLSSLQKGLEELARRAHAYKELTRCLEEARELLGSSDLDLDRVEPSLAELSRKRTEHETERAILARESRDLDIRRKEHQSALAALTTLERSELLAPPTAAEPAQAPDTLTPVAAVDVHAHARGLLARASELEAGGARLEQLEAELRSARRLRVRQQAARELAAELGLSAAMDEADPAQVPELLSEQERELQALEQSFHADADTLTTRQRLTTLRQEHAALDQRAACYLLAQEAAQRLQQPPPKPPQAARKTSAYKATSEASSSAAPSNAESSNASVSSTLTSASAPTSEVSSSEATSSTADVAMLTNDSSSAAPSGSAEDEAAAVEASLESSISALAGESSNEATASDADAATLMNDSSSGALFGSAVAVEASPESSSAALAGESSNEATASNADVATLTNDSSSDAPSGLAEGEAAAVEDLPELSGAALSGEATAHDADAVTPTNESLGAGLAGEARDDAAAAVPLVRVRKATKRRPAKVSEVPEVVVVQPALVLDSQAALLGLRDRLLAEQMTLAAQRDALELERERMQAEAHELNRGGAVYDPELLRVRDELGAELLAARFEDLEPEQAAWVQARLGPWVDALVVDDLAVASSQLGKVSCALDSVHLLRAGESLDISVPEAVSGEVITVEEPFGTRITRLPAVAGLGRRAREAKLRELWDAIAAHASALEQSSIAIQHNAAQRRDADVLWTHAAVFLGEDPLARREQLEAEISALEQRERERDVAEAQARSRLAGLRSRAQGLRRLLPDAQLLGTPDYAQRVREIEQESALLTRARTQLSQLTAARQTLSRLLDVLRNPPPDDESLAAQATRQRALETELDRIFRARSALEGVLTLRHAAQFADAQAALDAQAELSPALEQQQKQARQQLKAAESAYNAALRAWEAATGALQTAQAEKTALSGQRERLAQELFELGGPLDQLTADSAEQQLAAASAELQRLAEAARKSVAERALADERSARAEGEAQAAQARQVALSQEAEPIEHAWNALRAAAESAGVLHSALSIAAEPGRSSYQLQAEAKSKRELLLDRVARARGGDELSQSLQDASSDLDSWQAVRAFLGRRVPAQIAQVDDPLIALHRLSDHLNMLESRLTRQEGDLRGNSEDVARAIAVQLRRAHAQVRRLNQQLDGIHFGSIHGIRMEMRRIERMEQILHALREGQAQELLFSSNLPIEEALDEIFKRYGGGGKSGGQRLLDYREYVELAVEIRRQNAENWEPANPTRLSTGEAIGVGAALMMVVLTEWERAANLLGPRDKLGSIRFLFLDEANRLSRDNLGVLFDLCRTLDLQLLVAAPEVARADGNTTYRLVRHTTPDGREEVIVSGRRSVPVENGEPESETLEHEPEPEPEPEPETEVPLVVSAEEPEPLSDDHPQPEAPHQEPVQQDLL